MRKKRTYWAFKHLGDVLRCKPGTYQPISQWFSNYTIMAGHDIFTFYTTSLNLSIFYDTQYLIWLRFLDKNNLKCLELLSSACSRSSSRCSPVEMWVLTVSGKPGTYAYPTDNVKGLYHMQYTLGYLDEIMKFAIAVYCFSLHLYFMHTWWLSSKCSYRTDTANQRSRIVITWYIYIFSHDAIKNNWH